MTKQSVDRSSFSSVGSLFHAHSAGTEKALSHMDRTPGSINLLFIWLQMLTFLFLVQVVNQYIEFCVFR